MRRWGFDLSGSFALPNHWVDMVQHGLSFAMFRLGQGVNELDNPRPLAEAAIANHVPFSLYWVIHPNMDGVQQAAQFLKYAKQFSAKSLTLDIEESYGLPPEQINQVFHDAFDHMQAHCTLPFTVYSGWWFWESACQPAKAWIGQEVYHDANYRQYFAPETWAEFATQLADLYVPRYAGYPPVGVFQFAGDRPTTMIPHKIDYNLIDNDEVYNYLFHDGPRPTYLDAAPVVVPPPADLVKYKVTNASGTYLQAGPSWQASPVTYLKCGAIVYVDPTWTQVPNWLKVAGDKTGYVAANRVEVVK